VSGNSQPARPPRVIVVMGVASSGKTTVGQRLAKELGWEFRDADEFHPPENVAKMSAGTPLNDEDRAPWLAAIAAWIDARLAAGETGIVTCSALKRRYREVILGRRESVRLVHLAGDKATIAARMAKRRHHFMPTSLLDSQFAALEPPGADENPLVIPVTPPPARLTALIRRELGLDAPRL
jgi:gluconokinase